MGPTWIIVVVKNIETAQTSGTFTTVKEYDSEDAARADYEKLNLAVDPEIATTYLAPVRSMARRS